MQTYKNDPKHAIEKHLIVKNTLYYLGQKPSKLMQRLRARSPYTHYIIAIHKIKI